MRKYIEHIQNKSSHDRRQYAVQVSGILTAVVVILWLSTLDLRNSSNSTTTNLIAQKTLGEQTQTANVVTGFPVQSPASLEVATTSVLGSQ